MPLEIDMLSVKDADAIVIRTTQDDREHVVLIDAGDACDADTIISHLDKYTERHTHIDALIITHPHNDHIGGLPKLLETLKVCKVYVNDPSLYKQRIMSVKALVALETEERANKSICFLDNVIAQIDNDRIPRYEALAGQTLKLLDGATLSIIGPTPTLFERLAQAMKSHDGLRFKSDDCEELEENVDRSPFNNSSVISLLTYDNKKLLFTADAGPVALDSAVEFAEGEIDGIDWVQIPHHGSRRNINCEHIHRFKPTWALVSAIGDDDHPHPAVVRSFKAAGVKVYGTNKSGSLCHSFNALRRDGWSSSTELNDSGE